MATTAEDFCDDWAARRWWRRNGDEIHRRHLPGAAIDAAPDAQRITFRDGSVAHEPRRGRWEVAR
jgi:hypothetical protein